jgi:hypothetical protein
MTIDDIIRMALKCGASIKTDCEGNGIYGDGINVEQFANLVAAAEREACAEVCNAISTCARKDLKAKYNPHDDGRCHGAFECEEAIRARR